MYGVLCREKCTIYLEGSMEVEDYITEHISQEQKPQKVISKKLKI
jgi:hypothetical protein